MEDEEEKAVGSLSSFSLGPSGDQGEEGNEERRTEERGVTKERGRSASLLL